MKTIIVTGSNSGIGKEAALNLAKSGHRILMLCRDSEKSEQVFKKISVTGCSSVSYEKAIENAVEKASVSIRGLAWFEVKEFRGGLGSDGEIEWQATIEVAFKID